MSARKFTIVGLLPKCLKETGYYIVPNSASRVGVEVIRHVSCGLGDIAAVCQGTCRHSRKAELRTLSQRCCCCCWRGRIQQQAWLTAYPWSSKTMKGTGSWRRAGWLGNSQEQERHIQKWVRLSSPETCFFAPGNVCPGHSPGTTHSPPRVSIFPCRLIQASTGYGIWLHLLWAMWAFWGLYVDRRVFCMQWHLSPHIFLHR